MKRIVGAVCLLLGASATLLAVRAPNTRSIPNFDKRLAEHPPLASLSPEKQPAADRLQQMVPGVQLSVDRVLRSPNHIASPHGFLSGPAGAGKAISDIAARSIPAADPHHPIKAFLAEHAALFGHGPEALNAARIQRDYTTPHNGLRTTIWQQRLDDLDVFEATLMGHVTAQGELVNISSTLVADPQKAADAGLPGRKAKQEQPQISAQQALSLAAKAIEEDVLAESFIALDERPTGVDKAQRFHARPKLNDCRVQLVWLPMSGSQMRLAWLVRVVSSSRGEAFHVLIDADSGELLLRRTLTVYLTNATYNVFISDSPSPFSPGLQSPGTFQPPLVPRTLVTTTALDTNASPLGWIADTDNETKGNNVDAHLDRNRDDQPDLPRPQGNPRRVFDFPLNLTQDPTTYGNASVVSLFYWCNWMHDQLYNLGFNEAAGNLQDNNFGRGGLGNDAMQADAQDGSGFNNANLTPAFDGFPCRIQMYIFNGPNPNRDGDLDAEVMLHEYTHALSERLVGGGVLISELQTSGMGEGWSDFYALSLLSESTDDVDAAFASGGYVTFDFFGFFQNYYFGIRRYPYSTDMSRNPLTFKDIDPSQALAHFGVPLSPLFSPFSPTDADEVHNQGEVWCVTLWEARANLIKKWGYAVGNKLILQLVTDGMKLAPANPNFLQARDAIIQADQVNNNGANYNELWAAFAKRGMGGSASSPPSSTTAGVVEAFDVPGLALKQATIRDTLTGNANGVIDVDECIELFVTLRNNGRRAANNIATTLTTSTPGVTISQGDSAYPLIPVGATATNLTPFRLFVTPAFFCGSVIDLTLTIRSDQDTRTIKIRLPSGSKGSPIRYDSNTPVAIPDADPRGVDSPIDVSDFPGAIAKVTVSFYASHTWDGDLTFQLIAPDGTKVLLSSHNGFFGANYGGGCNDSSRTTFDDNASISILSGSPPYVGTFRPQQFLSTLNGKSGFGVNGTWRLHVTDDFFFDVGTLQCWSLNLSPSVCSEGGGECASDLAVNVSVKPNPPIVGSNLTYFVVATNRGPIAATGVYVTNILPAGLQFLSSSTTRGTCAQTNGVVTCAIGSLAPNTGATITIATHPIVTGYVTNTAVITAALADSNRNNNTNILVSLIPAPSPIIVPGVAHLVAEDRPPPNGGIDPDETVTVQFSLQNIGTGPASNLVATLLPTEGVSPVSGTESQLYGYVPVNAAPIARPFSFKATGTNGQIISPTLSLLDGTNDLGTISFEFGLHASFVFANPNVISVSDSVAGAASVYPSTIFVSGVPGVIGRVNVTLNNLTHSFADDLDILLVAPNGRTVLLMSDAGGGNPLGNVTLTFDDVAPPLPDSARIVSGSYRPTDYDGGDGDPFVAPAPAPPYGSTLASLNGIGANGLWSLFMLDDSPGDGGRMAGGWTLTIETIDPVDPTADLIASGTVDPASLVAGSNVVYNLSVFNQGPDNANNVLLTSRLPAGAIFVSGESAFGACSNSGSVVTCYVGGLSTQEEGGATITATLTRSGTATNVVTASADEVEPNTSNNSASILTTVSPAADVAVSIAAAFSPAVANQNLTLSVLVTNVGPNSATALIVTNRLPPGIPVASITPSQGTATTSGDTVRWTINSLSGGTGATLNVVLRPVRGGSITNSADVKSGQPVDLNLANNSASLVLAVSDGPVIIRPAGTVLVTESNPNGGIDLNERVTVSFALRNVGLSNSTSLVATLRNSGGVSPIGTIAQNYGVILAGGQPVDRSFTFTNSGSSGSTISATFDLSDAGNSIGAVTFPLVVGGVRQFSNPNLITIRDNATADPYPSTINISGVSGIVSRATVTLSNVSHTFPADIDVLLVAPNGRNVLLMSDVGGINKIANVNLTFDQASSLLLPQNSQITAGIYRPTDFAPTDHFPGPAPQGTYTADLSPLAGIDPNGTWSLFVVDDAVSDDGQMGGWSIDLTLAGPLNLPPTISLVTVANGSCQFTIYGQIDDRLTIQVSSDLQTWKPIGTNVLGSASMIFTDTPLSVDQRFYRVLRQP